MTKHPYLSVVIPAFNEEDNLRRGALNVVLAYLERQEFTWELILVDDGSTDSTALLLSEISRSRKEVRLINNPHQGKAATVISGALAARGDLILFSDMDQATPITEFDKFLTYFRSGSHIVIGSRSGRPNAPMFRQILAYGMVVCRSLILRLPFADTQCGFKAFTRPAAGKIFTLMQRLRPPREVTGPAVDPGFDVELLYLGRKLGFRIAEVPVTWRHQETRRVSFVKDAVAGLTGLLLVRYRSLTGAYNLQT